MLEMLNGLVLLAQTGKFNILGHMSWLDKMYYVVLKHIIYKKFVSENAKPIYMTHLCMGQKC